MASSGSQAERLTPPQRKQRREEIIQSLEPELRQHLSHRHAEIAQQPLGKMEAHWHPIESPVAKGKLRIMVTRTSSFSCMIKYLFDCSKPDMEILETPPSGTFRYVFDEEAEKAAAALKLKAVPSSGAVP